jgi:hypothetical protein
VIAAARADRENLFIKYFLTLKKSDSLPMSRPAQTYQRKALFQMLAGGRMLPPFKCGMRISDCGMKAHLLQCRKRNSAFRIHLVATRARPCASERALFFYVVGPDGSPEANPTFQAIGNIL